jgi:hypothetical protein
MDISRYSGNILMTQFRIYRQAEDLISSGLTFSQRARGGKPPGICGLQVYRYGIVNRGVDAAIT